MSQPRSGHPATRSTMTTEDLRVGKEHAGESRDLRR